MNYKNVGNIIRNYIPVYTFIVHVFLKIKAHSK